MAFLGKNIINHDSQSGFVNISSFNYAQTRRLIREESYLLMCDQRRQLVLNVSE